MIGSSLYTNRPSSRRYEIPKKKSKKKSRKRYQSIGDVSYENTREQAARMLDEAGFAAIANGDVNEMLAVALAWHEFSGVAFEDEQADDEEEEYHDVHPPFKVLGLSSHEERIRKEDEYHAGREQARKG